MWIGICLARLVIALTVIAAFSFSGTAQAQKTLTLPKL